MVKPIGAICNLDCGYCYYLEKEELYPESKSYRMADELLELYIQQHIEACPEENILFSWHGGEPTLLGIDYFQKILEIQKKHRPFGRKILNGIQTNGTLIDEDWCRFLAAERFHVGLSIDGPSDVHNHYRVTKKAEATHKQVMHAYRLFKKFRIHCDLLCVINERNVRIDLLDQPCPGTAGNFGQLRFWSVRVRPSGGISFNLIRSIVSFARDSACSVPPDCRH